MLLQACKELYFLLMTPNPRSTLKIELGAENFAMGFFEMERKYYSRRHGHP
jgi:hypothetical protein